MYTSTMLQKTDTKPEIYVAVMRRPYPPRNLNASGSAGVTLTWQASDVSRETKGYHVYRSVGNDAAFVELTTAAVNATAYTDNSVAAGQTYYYGVTSEEFSGLESDELSNIMRVDVTQSGVSAGLHRAQGLKGWDTTAPAQVSGFSMQQVAPGQYRLNWQASPDTDVRYYNVYYSVEGAPSPSPQRLIASAPRNTLTYLDWLARTDAAPYYAVTAVDRAGNESAPSSPSGSTDQTAPAAVRDLQSP
jgi:fibronectin type 3 domain-containing protein